jgi:hypothetical protein
LKTALEIAAVVVPFAVVVYFVGLPWVKPLYRRYLNFVQAKALGVTPSK